MRKKNSKKGTRLGITVEGNDYEYNVMIYVCVHAINKPITLYANFKNENRKIIIDTKGVYYFITYK